MASWLEEATENGHEPEMKPQEITTNVKENTTGNAGARSDDRHEQDA